MKAVARFLQEEAVRRTDNDERDSFGRSAFNRYYYATFLSVKSALGSFRQEWNTMPHKDVPEVLRGAVKKEIQAGRSKAQKASDQDTVLVCNKAVAATEELAELMEKGYATRVTADYNPQIRIDFSDRHDFELNTVHVKRASEWPDKAQGLIKTISVAWRQLRD